ncbi:hypothetical protein [Thalassospira sp.]|uniref:hypothetical protein n=1 Tax=Thalassospira sp. TaxID=1912094 RepID=UPI00273470FB|nr:hypothetical protein [Thalassospira sp.]MDP2698912.1 hypothetical protein [Thalassospira sp.]
MVTAGIAAKSRNAKENKARHRPLGRSEIISDFLKKVLDLFFFLWHNRKINGTNPPGAKPARLDALRVFAFGPEERGDDDAAI